MAEAPKDNDDEAKFNETLKRMLKTPPKPHKPKGAGDGRPPEAMPHKQRRSDKKQPSKSPDSRSK